MSETSTLPVLIVGAGISGLAAAKTLQAGGVESVILEKSRGLGGRCATRRFHGNSFDHGAQFFSIRNEGLRTLADEWLSQGQLHEWCRGFPVGADAESAIDGFPRYHSSPGMNSLAKLLAGGRRIQTQVHVSSIAKQESGWSVRSECGREWRSQSLIMTAPLPQTLALLDADIRRQLLARFPDLQTMEYEPCFTVMLALAGRSLIPPPAAISSPCPDIDWIADNSMKHETGRPAAVTVHTSADFSRRLVDAEHEEVANAVIASVSCWLGSAVEAWQVHRWRYARPRNSLSLGALALGDRNPLLLCGDYLNAPARIEGAFDSGVAAANCILAAR